MDLFLAKVKESIKEDRNHDHSHHHCHDHGHSHNVCSHGHQNHATPMRNHHHDGTCCSGH